jgi:hypothetical protein
MHVTEVIALKRIKTLQNHCKTHLQNARIVSGYVFRHTVSLKNGFGFRRWGSMQTIYASKIARKHQL